MFVSRIVTRAAVRSSGRAVLAAAQKKQVRAKSFFAHVNKGPEDPILGVTVAFNKSTNPKKLNLGVGAYRDDQGKPYVLNCVRQAEDRIHNAKMNHEYAGITGVPEFVKASAELIFGENAPLLKENRVVSSQVLSGTGALRVAADFLARFLPQQNSNLEVYFPQPTWGNHIPIFTDAGFQVKYMRYYDAKTIGLDEKGFLADIEAAAPGSVMLFHTCAHNPTGVDPSQEQWKKASEICKRKGHFVLFDAAYQGFASGDPERDVWPIRHFIEQGHQVMVCQSFAKNFGLYGERTGAIHIVTGSAAEKENVESQLKILIRPMYSNPPIHGARIITTVWNDQALRTEWRREVKLMADRIITMREQLVQGLKEAGSTRDWSHITKQIGMFCFSGLTPTQVDTLAEKYAIYMTRNGRISMAGLTSANVKYLAQAMHEVTKGQ